MLPELIDPNNTASKVWADTAYRSQANEKFLTGRLLRSQIHRKKPKAKPMPRRTARANARKSAARSLLLARFCPPEGPDGPVHPHHRLGSRKDLKIGLTNLIYNMQRMVWLAAQTAPT